MGYFALKVTGVGFFFGFFVLFCFFVKWSAAVDMESQKNIEKVTDFLLSVRLRATLNVVPRTVQGQ